MRRTTTARSVVLAAAFTVICAATTGTAAAAAPGPVASVPLITTTGVERPSPEGAFVVANTNGRGMSIRQIEPAMTFIKHWPEGTRMVALGKEQDAYGWTWKSVRDPDGNVGWVPSNYLAWSGSGNGAAATVTMASSDPSTTSASTAAASVPMNDSVSTTSSQASLGTTTSQVSATPDAVPAGDWASPQVASFMEFVGPRMMNATLALATLDSIEVRAETTTVILSDKAYQTEVRAVLAVLRQSGLDLQAYRPDSIGVEAAHATTVAIGNDLVYVADEYAAGIAQLDASRIRQAQDRRQILVRRFAELGSQIKTTI